MFKFRKLYRNYLITGSARRETVKMMGMLKADIDFVPYPVRDGDELFPNGIFEFNVTRIFEYLESNPKDVNLVEVAVSDFHPEFSSIDKSHIESVDISRPLVLVEISPENYNLIDGHHRVEKIRRLGTCKMLSYKLTVLQHIAFLTSKNAYLSYIQYWNSKVKQNRQLKQIEQSCGGGK